MFTLEQMNEVARGYAYALHDRDRAESLGCRTIEDVEYQELIGALPAGTADSLSMYGNMPTRLDADRQELLRDFLFVEKDLIDEDQLIASYQNPEVLNRFLAQQDSEVIEEFMLREVELISDYEESDYD